MAIANRIQHKQPDICIGDLRHRIVIEYGAEASVGGNIERTWTTLSTVWTMIEPMTTKATEIWKAKLGFPVTHMFYIRYLSTVTVHNRIKFGTRYFDIRAVNNLGEDNLWMEIVAEERE